jgi:flagellar biosynthetic protein FliP
MNEFWGKKALVQAISFLQLKTPGLLKTMPRRSTSLVDRPLITTTSLNSPFSWLLSPMTLGLGVVLCMVLFSQVSLAQGLPMVNVTGGKNGQQYSLTLQLLALMTTLSLLPSMLLMMTSFVRIIIVLSLVRQALGTGQTPPNTVLVGLALFLTLFIMSPVFEDIYNNALSPYMNGNMPFEKALGIAEKPIRDFMMLQTREDDINMFMQIAQKKEVVSADDVPFTTLMPAFITSELKSAFTIGFMIYIPFVVIDLIVASVLMSMGMMMLSPMIISMPFKLMLFVLVDGWTLLMGSLASSFVFK